MRWLAMTIEVSPVFCTLHDVFPHQTEYVCKRNRDSRSKGWVDAIIDSLDHQECFEPMIPSRIMYLVSCCLFIYSITLCSGHGGVLNNYTDQSEESSALSGSTADIWLSIILLSRRILGWGSLIVIIVIPIQLTQWHNVIILLYTAKVISK